MKQILLFLLISTSIFAQNPTKFEKVRITTNVTDNTATKVNVQSSDGQINTIDKINLIDALYYDSAVNLPVVGITDKLYLTRDNNILYRFNGTIYVPLSADVSGKEDKSNKISAITGYSEIFYPNEKATKDALDAKLNISDLPSNLTLYATNVPSGVSTYTKWVTTLNDPDYNTTAVNISTGVITGTNQLLSGLSSIGGVIVGNPGEINVTTVGEIRRTAGSGTAKFYFELYKRSSAGVEEFLGVSNFTLPVGFETYAEFSATSILNNGIFLATDRLVIKFYGSRISGGSDPTFDFQFGGLTPVRTIVPVPFRVLASEYELKANKQNSLAVDGTNTFYPTVTAVNAEVVKLTGDQTILGKKTFTNGSTGRSIVSVNLSSSDGISSDNQNTGTGIYSSNQDTGTGIRSDNYGSGNGIVSNQKSTGTGFNYIGQNNGSNTYTVNKLGEIRSTKIINSTAPPTNILLAGGTDITQASLPVSTATQTALNLKANLASPTFTGAPLAPTATAGTNTTQVATTAFVSTADSGNVKLTGNQTITGIKTFTNTGTTLINGLIINQNGTGGTNEALIVSTSTNTPATRFTTTGSGIAVQVLSQGIGAGVFAQGTSTGDNIVANIVGGTGFNYVGKNNGVNTYTVDKLGATTATSFINSTAPATNALLGNGTTLANPISGTGTTNFLPKFTASGTVGNSSISEVGGELLNTSTVNGFAANFNKTAGFGATLAIGNTSTSSDALLRLFKPDGVSFVNVYATSNGVLFSEGITSTQYRISSLNTAPSSATATGITGEIRITAGFIYVCTATNTWVRTALATW